MVKWRTYWMSRPVRDNISVEKTKASTLFLPNFKNKTTSVAQVNIDANQPNYLIKSGKNEVMRLIMGGIAFSTAVVLSKKLGRNEVRSTSRRRPVMDGICKENINKIVYKLQPKMKRVIFLFFVLFVPLFAAAQTERVTDAPAWFFNPPAGEYAGVSMPLESYDLARQQAVYAALLSFVAQNEVEIEFTGSEVFSESLRIVEQFRKCIFNLPVNYNIVKTAINQYGEVFVSLQIMSDDSNNANITIVAELYSIGLDIDGFSKMQGNLLYVIEEARKLPNEMNGNIWYSEKTINDTTRIANSIERVTQRSWAKENFVPEQMYSYCSTLAEVIPVWSGRPTQYSLGIAYTSALLTGIMQDCMKVTQAIEKVLQKYSSYNGLSSKADENGEYIKSSSQTNKIVKPANSITAGIDNGYLYLIEINKIKRDSKKDAEKLQEKLQELMREYFENK